MADGRTERRAINHVEPQRPDRLDAPKLSAPSSVDRPSSQSEVWLARLAWAQGVFYFVTGIWPLVHMSSFVAVTGPKTDLWLVRTVGGLLSVIGVALWSAGRRRRVTRELGFVGAGSAAVLIVIDVVYVTKEVISSIYLLDAAVEVGIVAAWIGCAAMQISISPTSRARTAELRKR